MHPFSKEAKTGEQRADARYTQKSAAMPDDPLMADARRNPKLAVPDEVYAGAPARQICNTGKVRK